MGFQSVLPDQRLDFGDVFFPAFGVTHKTIRQSDTRQCEFGVSQRAALTTKLLVLRMRVEISYIARDRCSDRTEYGDTEFGSGLNPGWCDTATTGVAALAE